MALFGGFALFMLALVFGGGRVFERFLPDSAMVWVEELGNMGVTSLSPSDKGPGDTPESHLRDTSDGWKASNKIAAMPGNKAVFISDVITGRRAAIDGHSPAAVEVATPVQDCTLTPPTAEAFVGHVFARFRSNITLGLATYGDAELAGAVEKFAKIYRETGMKRVEGLRESRFDAFDVVVTETQKPVYLVLQSHDVMRLWNIHLAPGARLERVIVLGGIQAGVINVPADVPVEIMRSAEMAACGAPFPFYPLNPGAMLFQSLEAGHLDPDEAEETLGQIAEQGRRYDAWFRQHFGVSADETLAGNWVEGSIAVAGPVPATPEGRAAWQPVKGGIARITIDTYLEYQALADQGADFQSRVIAIATAFAWGDLNNLKQGVEF